MNKSQLIDAISEQADLTKVVAARALDAVVKAITTALASGEQVSLVGFGTFDVKRRSARTGRNPKTGDVLHIPESLVPVFKAGRGLKDAVASEASLETAES